MRADIPPHARERSLAIVRSTGFVGGCDRELHGARQGGTRIQPRAVAFAPRRRRPSLGPTGSQNARRRGRHREPGKPCLAAGSVVELCHTGGLGPGSATAQGGNRAGMSKPCRTSAADAGARDGGRPCLERFVLPAAALVGVSLIFSACGGGASPGVASVGTTPNTTSPFGGPMATAALRP